MECINVRARAIRKAATEPKEYRLSATSPYSAIGLTIGFKVFDELVKLGLDDCYDTFEIVQYILDRNPQLDRPNTIAEYVDDYLWEEEQKELDELFRTEYAYSRIC